MKKTLLFWALFLGIFSFAGCSEESDHSFAEQSCKENSWTLIKNDQWIESCLFEGWKRCPLASIEEWDCFLIENKPWLAVKDAEKLYDCFGNTYINNIDDSCTLQMTGSELLHQFIDKAGRP